MSFKNSRGQHVCYLASEHDAIGAEYHKRGHGKYYVYRATIPAGKPFYYVHFDLIGIVETERKARQLCRTIIIAHEDKPRCWCTSQMAVFGHGMSQPELWDRDKRETYPSDFQPY